MTIKYLPDGQDFPGAHFSRDFGFTGSAEGRHDARNHPKPPNTEYGDGLKRGGRVVKKALGGPLAPGQVQGNPVSARCSLRCKARGPS